MNIEFIPSAYNIHIPDSIKDFIKLEDGTHEMLDKRRPLRIERRDYHKDVWCIHDGFGCMNRQFKFDYESLPSNREDEWLADHRFSLEEAKKLVTQLFSLWEKNGVEDPRK